MTGETARWRSFARSREAQGYPGWVTSNCRRSRLSASSANAPSGGASDRAERATRRERGKRNATPERYGRNCAAAGLRSRHVRGVIGFGAVRAVRRDGRGRNDCSLGRHMPADLTHVNCGCCDHQPAGNARPGERRLHHPVAPMAERLFLFHDTILAPHGSSAVRTRRVAS